MMRGGKWRGDYYGEAAPCIFLFSLSAGLCLAGAAWADIPLAEEGPTAQPESELWLTDTPDLAGLFLQGYCYPVGAWVWTPAVFQPMTIVWANTSDLPVGLAAITNASPTSVQGVPAWPLWVTLWPQSNTVTVLQPWSDETLTEFSVSDGFPSWPVYQDVLFPSCIFSGINYTNWETLVAEGNAQFSVPQVVAHAWLMDVANRDTFWNNLDAPDDAVAGAAGMSGSFMSMDEEDDGSDPCSITNLLQAFMVTGVATTNNRAISITFQSCQTFRYLISYANSLSTHTSWIPLAYVWGQTNTSSTTFTDLSTTNNDGSTVSQRFYRVQRLLGGPIAAGGDHSLAVTPDNRLWAWGSNEDGQLSDGLGGDVGVEAFRPYPGEVADPTVCVGQIITNAVAVAGGGNEFTMVVDDNGTVWAAGENLDGEQGGAPGFYDNGDHFPATAISGLSNIVNVAAGQLHVLALRADGAVFAWGSDSDEDGDPLGQLGVRGLPYPYYTSTPTQSLVTPLVVAVAAGAYHSVALDMSGGVWVWGRGWEGQLANGLSGYGVATNVPITVAGISNVIAVAAGAYHTLALTADKLVYSFGDNSYGELGRTGDNTMPGLVTNLTNVVAIAGGVGFSLAVTGDGRLFGWGDGAAGELGVPGVSSTNVPIQMPGISNVVLVSASSGDPSSEDSRGERHVVAITVDGGTNHYWGWGDNSSGAVGAATDAGTVTTPAQVQFCTRCQREIQLGTGGVFTGQCNGTLYLYFNDDQTAFSDNAGSFTATVDGFAPVAVMANNASGVAVGAVTNGGVYTYSASGTCNRNASCTNCAADANGNGTNVDCSSINITNAVCPVAKCFSLVGKIQ